MPEDARNPQNDRELLVVIHTELQLHRAETARGLDDLSRRVGKVEVSVGDALPNATARISALEDADNKRASRKEAWIAAAVGALAAWALGFFQHGPR